MSDVVWQAMIGGAVALGLGWIRLAIARMDRVARQTHLLVNSKMDVQLQLNATVTRRLAELTGEQRDKEAATLAEGLLRDHREKQEMVDASIRKVAKAKRE